ncbi:MAG: hypothetical protein ACRESZ_12350 [Methylococcales bacterium]
MKPILNDDEFDEIFDWLKEYLIEPVDTDNELELPPAKPELRELAWQAAQANHQFLLDHGLYQDRINLS